MAIASIAIALILNFTAATHLQNKYWANTITLFKHALDVTKDNDIAHQKLGEALASQGKTVEAVNHYYEALRINPNLAAAQINLGVSLRAEGKLDQAIEHFSKVVRLNPNSAIAYYEIGQTLEKMNKFDAAVRHFSEALRIKPNTAKVHNNLGIVLARQKKENDAISHFYEALGIDPNYADAHYNLGNVFEDQGRLSETMECYQMAIRLKPDYAEAYSNLGVVLKNQGRLDEATECCHKALQLKPDFVSANSNLLMGLHYHEQTDPVDLFSQHKRWAEQHASPFVVTIRPHINDRSAERCLRLGYVSPDFRVHSVAYFIEAVIASHDRTAFEAICYSDVSRPDSMTNHLKGLAGHWRDIVGMSDEQVADLIRNDRIDILVDLAGHTAKNRMPLFARKPGPVQVTYLGYPNTTGLPTMDYRITDLWADPPGQTDHLYTEELVRLAQGFLCYKPPVENPVVAKTPVLETGNITFASFNNRPKITPEVVRSWSKILTAVPNAKLVLKSKPLSDPGTRGHLLEMFVQNGVSSDRIRFVGYISSQFKHLELYNSIDIGLDTFPYNGTTTTCEAMWMGVPVIALAGESHVSRVGVSLLTNAGLPELMAESAEDYVEKAVKLACDPKRLQAIRSNLRSMMGRSPLMDAQGFTRALEAAYRQMWHRWCGQGQD